MGNGSILMVTDCLNAWFPGSFWVLCLYMGYIGIITTENILYVMCILSTFRELILGNVIKKNFTYLKISRLSI